MKWKSMPPFTPRVSHLEPEGAYAVLAKSQALEAQGREIIHFEIGEPDFNTYPNIVSAGIEAISTGKTRYNPPSGIAALRQVLATDAGQRRGVRFSPEQVVIGPGTKPLMMLPMLAVLEPGDEVIYPDPGFPSYAAAIGIAGATPVRAPLLEKHQFDLDPDALDKLISPKTRMIILNSPSNPTGSVLSAGTMAHLADVAVKHDLWIISDEIYSRFVYDGVAPSIISLPGMSERTIIADGFSKAYAMTGWRLGYGIMPEALADRVGLLLTHSVGCTATFTQYAGMEAVLGTQDPVDAVRAEFQRRRDAIVKRLNDIPGVACLVPQGAFYVFPNVRSFKRPSAELADYLLEEAGVAVLSGTDFGKYGEGCLRLSYTNSLENIHKGLDRMKDALARLR
jgi:aspartate/methionine/tyrosine aminotransferase